MNTKLKYFEGLVAILVIIDIILLTFIIFFTISPNEYTAILYYDLIVTLILIPDFFYRLLKAEDKKEFLYHNWPDIIGMVPLIVLDPLLGAYSPASRYFRLIGIIRILVLFRTDLTRFYRFLHRTHLDLGVLSLIFVLFAGTCAFYYAELGVNPSIHTFLDALWFVFISITTVGYGDISPYTVYGRIITVLIIISGVIFLGFLTAALSSWLIKEEDTDELKNKLEKLESSMNEMRSEMKAEIKSLKELIEKQK